jgi:hypothetical protein
MTEKLNGPSVELAERRSLPRYRPSSVAYVNVGTDNGGILLNISESGLQLAAGETLAWDNALRLSLQLSYQADLIEATGQVIWLSESKRTGGFQFVSLPDEVRNQIRDWISGEGNATADRSHPREGGETTALAHPLEPSEATTLASQAPPAEIIEPSKLSGDRPPEILELAERAQEGPSNEPRFGWFAIAIAAGLMVVCFAAGVIVGATWVGRAVGNTTAVAPRADAAQTSARGDSTPTETTSLVPTAAATNGAASGSTQSPDDFVLVTPPDQNAQPELVTLPQMAVGASRSIAISVRRFVLVPPARGPASEHHPERVVGGRIAGPPVEPLPSGVAIDAAGDVVRLRLSIDEDGELNDLIKMEGRADLVEIAERAVRRWIQTPSRLEDKPIASIEDVTVTFRP